ncbi:hypothetical protein JOB18_036291 [Solea senegalensis]|uniref:Uncharacterized protein n=1 Tax=Solea senegalensis TaxID=28829 RepID=A0AAV6SNG8_SOLSE|nr:hypothetical protein JOB18_036291 [Solea senegalensis]
MWLTGNEAEADHREELYTLHVLNLLVEGQRCVEGMEWNGMEKKCSLRPKWSTRWQVVGQTGPLKLTPGLCAGMDSAIDPAARNGREGSKVPPEGLQTMDHAQEESKVSWGLSHNKGCLT